MRLAKVIGTVVSTIKNEPLKGKKLLLIKPLDKKATPSGRAMIALDSVGAGFGEIVYYVRGKEASFPFLPQEVPTDTTVVGIVDTINKEL